MPSTKTSTNTRRSKIDWEGIEREWRVGKLTQREIADRYGVSDEGMRKRFKKLGITRDLTETVRAATKAALIEKAKVGATEVGQQIGAALGKAQLSAVESAVTENVRIIESHRKDIGRLKETLVGMGDELAQLLGRSDEVKAIIEQIEPDNEKLAGALSKSTSLMNRAAVLEKMAASLVKLIDAERKAHNMDDEKSNTGSSIEDVLAEIRANENIA